MTLDSHIFSYTENHSKTINLRQLSFVISCRLCVLDYMFFPVKKFLYILGPPSPLWSSSSESCERETGVVLRKIPEKNFLFVF